MDASRTDAFTEWVKQLERENPRLKRIGEVRDNEVKAHLANPG